MEVLHPRCAGRDVHKDTVVAAVPLIEDDGTVRREVETFATTTPGLVALSDWPEGHACPCGAMEATGIYWRPVWQVLAAEGPGEGRTLVLANAAHVKNVPGRKTDVADAVWLSDLLAHGLIGPSFVPDTGTRAMRDLLRTRKQLVREQAGLCPRQDESAGKRRSNRLKKGAPWLKTALVQAAWAAVRKHGYLQAQFQRPRGRRGARKAICAVAASILTAVYHMLNDGTAYADLGPDHFRTTEPISRARALARQIERLGFTCSISAATPVSI